MTWPPLRDAQRVTVVAEIGPNHAGSYERAEALVRKAADSGADAVKLQVYEPDHLAVKSDLRAHRLPDDDGPWAGLRLWDLYDEGRTPVEWYPRLAEVGEEVGVVVFASAFDRMTFTHLERYDCPAYKVASAEVEDVTLMSALDEMTDGKPIVLSDGVASRDRIASEVMRFGDRRHVTVLHCASGYPAHPGAYDLDALDFYRSLDVGVDVGISDHTPDFALAIVAVSRGATMIEKHFMLDDDEYDEPPLDAGHSLTPIAFASYVDAIRRAESLLIDVERPRPTAWRRRIVVTRDVAKGKIIREANVRTARCSVGVEAFRYYDVVGRRAMRDLVAGEPLAEGDVDR